MYAREGAAVSKALASMRALNGLLPDSQQLVATVDAYARSVAIDAWALRFTRPDGGVIERLSGSPDEYPERLTMVRTEAKQLRRRDSKVGVQPAATPISPFHFGLVVQLDDERGGQGALLLLRGQRHGEFGLQDHSILLEARGEVVQIFNRQDRLDDAASMLEYAKMRRSPTMLILREDLQIEAAGKGKSVKHQPLGSYASPGRRLPEIIESEIRGVFAGWKRAGHRVETVIMPIPGMLIRVVPLTHKTGMLSDNEVDRRSIGILIEPFEERSVLSGAMYRFRLTNRELDIATQLLSGLGTTAIAKKFQVSEATVTDHVRRLLTKTGAANRVEMAAKLLGWQNSKETRD